MLPSKEEPVPDALSHDVIILSPKAAHAHAGVAAASHGVLAPACAHSLQDTVLEAELLLLEINQEGLKQLTSCFSQKASST